MLYFVIFFSLLLTQSIISLHISLLLFQCHILFLFCPVYNLYIHFFVNILSSLLIYKKNLPTYQKIKIKINNLSSFCVALGLGSSDEGLGGGDLWEVRGSRFKSQLGGKEIEHRNFSTSCSAYLFFFFLTTKHFVTLQ